jgi:hypothetical protein
MELYRRLHKQVELDKEARRDSVVSFNAKDAEVERSLEKVLRNPSANQTTASILGKFWEQYGWDPFQRLLKKVHSLPRSKYVFDCTFELNKDSFVYEMSVNVGKDVSEFFEKEGWEISAETKRRILVSVTRGR